MSDPYSDPEIHLDRHLAEISAAFKAMGRTAAQAGEEIRAKFAGFGESAAEAYARSTGRDRG